MGFRIFSLKRERYLHQLLCSEVAMRVPTVLIKYWFGAHLFVVPRFNDTNMFVTAIQYVHTPLAASSKTISMQDNASNRKQG